MSSGGHNKKNLSTSRFKRIDSFSLNHNYQSEIAITLKTNNVPQKILLSKLPNNYGGLDKIFFICPRCKSRIRFLFITKEALFCRHCCKVSYPSQRCGDISKVFYRLDPLFRKLKANTDSEYMIRYIPPRPRYMRHNVYVEIIERITELQNHHWAQFIDWTQKFINNRQMHMKRKE